jgi:hypothetical protein
MLHRWLLVLLLPLLSGAAALGVAPATEVAPGLHGEVFRGVDFSDSDRIETRVDGTIDFDWGKAPPDEAVRGTKFGIRWTGHLKVEQTGSYLLIFNVDDGVRLWIDGQLVVGFIGGGKDWRTEKRVDLKAGQHEIRIDYGNIGGRGFIHFSWATEKEPKPHIIPAECFTHDRPKGKGK